MKKLYLLALSFLSIACVKKQVQQQEEDLVIQAMVNGQWKVTSFNEGSADVTADFAPYSFQFKTNYTVDAINSGMVEKTGSWNADASSQTITSNFSNVANPLALLNGTWLITNSTWTSVQARQTVSGETRTLRLDKQ